MKTLADVAVRRALIRLLWNSVADGAECVCEPNDPGPECEAMSALGWGEHWDSRRFQRNAKKENHP